jgi:ubiquinol-cytochrome c reductase cytochrome b subunit
LGDGYGEKHGNGFRFELQQESSNVGFLMWFHEFFASRGYCSTITPKLHTRIGVGNKVRFFMRVKTWTFSSFQWIVEGFYPGGGHKTVPLWISDYLTPLALAVWIMGDGSVASSGMKLCTNVFTFSDVQFLCLVLYEKYGIRAKPNLAGGGPDQFVVYVYKESMPLLSQLVRPYIVPSMHYKLNGY